MEPQPAAPQTPTMSLAGRLINIFATPGEVFDEVKAAPPSVANWLLPILLSAVVGTLASFAMFSQPAIQQQIREQQAKVLEQQVKAGKMSQADADRAEAMMEKFSGPAMLAIFGSLAAVFFSAIHAVWWGFLLWLAARWFLKTRITYAKSLEVAGLAMMITMLSGIVTILLTVVLGRMAATPSLALLVTDFNPTRRSHATMGAVNIFYFWLVAVMSTGLARLSGVPFWKAVVPVAGFWVLEESLLILVGLGQFAL